MLSWLHAGSSTASSTSGTTTVPPPTPPPSNVKTRRKPSNPVNIDDVFSSPPKPLSSAAWVEERLVDILKPVEAPIRVFLEEHYALRAENATLRSELADARALVQRERERELELEREREREQEASASRPVSFASTATTITPAEYASRVSMEREIAALQAQVKDVQEKLEAAGAKLKEEEKRRIQSEKREAALKALMSGTWQKVLTDLRKVVSKTNQAKPARSSPRPTVSFQSPPYRRHSRTPSDLHSLSRRQSRRRLPEDMPPPTLGSVDRLRQSVNHLATAQHSAMKQTPVYA